MLFTFAGQRAVTVELVQHTHERHSIILFYRCNPKDLRSLLAELLDLAVEATACLLFLFRIRLRSP